MYIYAYLAFLLAIPVAEGSAEEGFGAKFVGWTPVTIDGGAANLPPTSKGGLDSGSIMKNIYFYTTATFEFQLNFCLISRYLNWQWNQNKGSKIEGPSILFKMKPWY